MSAQRRSLFRVVARPLQAFLHLEAASGVVLLLATVVALLWANLDASSYFALFIERHALRAGELAATFSMRALINDGLMTIFFLVVGMEIKRELAVGELKTASKASLPAIAAIGGMIVPIGVFLALTWGTPAARGWAIPMATDIAFCVGILSLLRDRVPRGLIVFVTALAIFDDVGGIVVIALFYGNGLSAKWLLGALIPCLALGTMNRRHVGSGAAYAFVGAALWYTLHHAGIHAAIAGVIVGLAIPVRSRWPSRDIFDEPRAPLDRLIHALHPLVAFGIMPLFALANAGVEIRYLQPSSFASPVALGTAAGLFVGKQIGIFGATLLAVRLGLAPLPGKSSVAKLLGASVVAGIGFTIALFIAALAFEDDAQLLEQAKLGILLGSFLAGVVGFFILRFTRSAPIQRTESHAASEGENA